MKTVKTVTETPEEALRGTRTLFVSLAIFSCFVNILMLTGPLYMLQVYDRVIPSRSEETLLALTVLIAALFAVMGVLDYVRGRVAARVGRRRGAGPHHPEAHVAPQDAARLRTLDQPIPQRRGVRAAAHQVAAQPDRGEVSGRQPLGQRAGRLRREHSAEGEGSHRRVERA